MTAQIPRFALAGILTFALLALLSAAPAPGQVTTYDELSISVSLDGFAFLSGQCNGGVDPASGLVELFCTHDVGAGATASLRRGSPTGSVAGNLGSGSMISGDVNLGGADTAALITGELYVVISDGGDRTIAARLLPNTPIREQVMRFPLRQDSLVFSGSSATGNCALRVSVDRTDFRLLCHSDVANPTEILVMRDGGIVSRHDVSGNPVEASLPALGQSYDAFLDGDFGIILASQAFPDGEIAMVADRCLLGPSTLCLNEQRFEVNVDFVAPEQAGPAIATRSRSEDSGLFFFFRPNNWEVGVKVLDGCPVNGFFWVFVSANTDVGFTIRVYDTITGRDWTHTDPQGVLATSQADVQAFSCS